MSAPAASRLALGLLLVSVTLVAVAIGFSVAVSALPSQSMLAFAVAFPVVGALIASRQPRNAVGWLILTIGLSAAALAASNGLAAYATVRDTAGPTGSWVWFLWSSSFLWIPPLSLTGTFLLLLFPDGHLPSRRWRPVAWAAGVGFVGLVLVQAFAPWSGGFEVWDTDNPPNVLPRNPLGLSDDPDPFNTSLAVLAVVMMAAAFASIASLIVRYRRAGPVQRRQIKWVASALAVAIAVYALGDLVKRTAAAVGVPFSWEALGVILVALIAASFGVAILRHRLYDIDRIIRRTTTYTVVTAVLAGVYVAVAVLPSALFRLESDLIVAAATLLAAAAFGPVRRRVQGFVDRRFDRARYDARRTVGAFGQRLRDEVDLQSLQAQLITVVATSLRPVHASLWLPADPARRP